MLLLLRFFNLCPFLSSSTTDKAKNWHRCGHFYVSICMSIYLFCLFLSQPTTVISEQKHCVLCGRPLAVCMLFVFLSLPSCQVWSVQLNMTSKLTEHYLPQLWTSCGPHWVGGDVVLYKLCPHWNQAGHPVHSLKPPVENGFSLRKIKETSAVQ